MRIKSYFSGTVESAMELARNELGEDAVILNSRAAPADARHLGAYEVVFGVDDLPAAPSRKDPAGEPTAAPGHRFEVLEGEIVALRHELRKMSRGILAPEPFWAGRSDVSSSREEQDLAAYLMRRDLPEGAARELVRRGRERLGHGGATGPRWRQPLAARVPGEPLLFNAGTGVFPAHPGLLAGMFADESPLAAAVLDQLVAVLRIDPSLGRAPGGTKVVALVGGPGVGKTTTLVKLAAHYGLRARRPAHIISTDNLRVGAAEQLRSYAAILGIGFDLAETATALGQLLNEYAGKDLILIDTPGLGPGQMEDGAAIARFLGSDPRIDCHLVVPAYQKAADVSRLRDRFHAYDAAKVILTRLDETETIGGLLLALDESEAQISFLSMGQTIPEDLEPASVARLLDLFVGDPPMGAFLRQRPRQQVAAGSRG
jgi:flagellar biosynthesis GTPase FlhF